MPPGSGHANEEGATPLPPARAPDALGTRIIDRRLRPLRRRSREQHELGWRPPRPERGARGGRDGLHAADGLVAPPLVAAAVGCADVGRVYGASALGDGRDLVQLQRVRMARGVGRRDGQAAHPAALGLRRHALAERRARAVVRVTRVAGGHAVTPLRLSLWNGRRRGTDQEGGVNALHEKGGKSFAHPRFAATLFISRIARAQGYQSGRLCRSSRAFVLKRTLEQGGLADALPCGRDAHEVHPIERGGGACLGVGFGQA